MITLSPSATKQLHISCALHNSYIRLALRAGGCAGYSYDWSLDDRKEDDIFIEPGLIIDSLSHSLIAPASIDFIQDIFSSSWEINSTAATSSCGCGKSIFIKQDGTSKLIDETIGGCNG